MVSMNLYEKQLVEDHLYLVKSTILNMITINESIQGLGYDDLYQVGCEALCYAAINYNKDRAASFVTFANIVIRSRLLSHCRKSIRGQSLLYSLDAPIPDNPELTFSDTIPDDNDHSLSNVETYYLLKETKKRYSGISLKGIEALLLKCQGYSSMDIARYYGVKPNHIAAWISRAASKLRTDEVFSCS